MNLNVDHINSNQWNSKLVCECVCCVCDIVYNYQQKICFFRRDLQDVDQLPECMIFYLNSIMTVVIEIEEELILEGRLHHKHNLVKSVYALFCFSFYFSW